MPPSAVRADGGKLTLRIATVLAVLLVASFASAATRPVSPVDPIPGAASTAPADVGRWSAPFDGQAPAVNMVLLHDGRVLYWSGVEAGENDNVFFLGWPDPAQSRIWDPVTDTVTTPADPYGLAGDLFCSGQVILPDGKVLVAGGSSWETLDESAVDAANEPGADPAPVVRGLKDARAFDPATGAWSRVSDMNVGRWYPTIVELPDGRALAASGIQDLTDPRTHDTLLETSADAGASWGAIPGADRLLPLYPRLFVVPSGPLKGDLFYETVGTMWGPFGEHPLEAEWSLEQSYDPDTNAWTNQSASAFGARQHAASVILPLSPADGYTARILTFGGTLQRSVVATPASEITTLGPSGITHQLTGLLNHPRWHLNGVGLPDGSVLAVGGGLYDNVVVHGQPNVPILTAEKYDGATASWQQMAAMTVPRMYHSTAILLPDGRVLAGGHVPLPVPWKAARDDAPYEDQIAEKRLEIYEPPYLFWGARPQIQTVTPTVGYDDAITVTIPPGSVAPTDAILVHPGSTTHALDIAQRSVVLPIQSASGTTYTFQAPPDGDVAPPGDWMLFLRHHVTGKGDVPSVAKFVHLG